MCKYVLIGIPNSGKSTIGKLAAEKLQIPFYNTDMLAYERLNLDNPAMMFLPSNIMRLMEEQSKLLIELAKREGSAIIEVWPESVLKPQDAKVLKKIGKIIYVKREKENAIAESKERGKLFLQDMATGKKLNTQVVAVNMYAKEIHRFEDLADLTLINNGNLDEVVETLVQMIRNAK